MLAQIAEPFEICLCPNKDCQCCLLSEEETEAWDDEVYEGESKERVMECYYCLNKVKVTLLTKTKSRY